MATTPFGWRPWAQNGYGLQRWTATNHVPITPLYDEGWVRSGGSGGEAAAAATARGWQRMLISIRENCFSSLIESVASKVKCFLFHMIRLCAVFGALCGAVCHAAIW